ncbi:hypothetical protein [Herbidospora mongoliensis]|uniref:hypothetical protein n=1 Tax=Herbidospora mongoliensis TaxID=688067 RepID=UPI000829D2BB|nr:hypothetical protein [Herbidospora mongoliensis]
MLAEALAALAATAGSAVVTAMATDAWEDVKARCAQLIGRGDGEAAGRQAERLESARAELLAADDRDQTAGALEAAWTVRLRDFLEDHPDAEARLRDLVEFAQAHAPASAAGAVQVNASAYDQAQQAVQGQGVQNVNFGPPRS